MLNKYRRTSSLDRLLELLDTFQHMEWIDLELLRELREQANAFTLASERESLQELKRAIKGRFDLACKTVRPASARTRLQRSFYHRARSAEDLIALLEEAEGILMRCPREKYDRQREQLVILRAEVRRFVTSRADEPAPPSAVPLAMAG